MPTSSDEEDTSKRKFVFELGQRTEGDTNSAIENLTSDVTSSARPKLFMSPGTTDEGDNSDEINNTRDASGVAGNVPTVATRLLTSGGPGSRSGSPAWSLHRGGAESPLLVKKGNVPIQVIPRTPSLARVSTYGSALNQPFVRQDSTTSRSRVRYTGVGSRKIRRRAVFKNGDCNVLQSRIARRRLRFLQDIFTTLVDSQWRWTLLAFALSFIGSWLAFAAVWWLIAFTHGDLEPSHLPSMQEESGWAPCVSQIYSFTSCFLFSIETQHTIGYGSRATTEECPEAVFVMCLQSIYGVMVQAFMVGIVFAKMTRPKHRTQTLLFSRNAVICQRNGQLCLMFRVGDMRKSHIIGASIRAQLIRTHMTKEGEVLNQYQTELNVGADGGNENLFFIWPMTIVHKIDDASPFFNLSASDLLQERFEIVVVLEGTIESTGQTTQARSSYLASEILWGHRFDPVVCYNKDRQGYEVDYSNFNSTTQVDTPLCSGRELAEFYKIQEEFRPVGMNSDGQSYADDPSSALTLQDPTNGRNVQSDGSNTINVDEILLAQSEESNI